jgi:hypothetical protein
MLILESAAAIMGGPFFPRFLKPVENATNEFFFVRTSKYHSLEKWNAIFAQQPASMRGADCSLYVLAAAVSGYGRLPEGFDTRRVDQFSPSPRAMNECFADICVKHTI